MGFDGRDGDKDGKLDFHDFYNGFMAPYFGCYRCEDSKKSLSCLDMDDDGFVDWNEFRYFLLWAGRQHPEVKNAQELLDIAFRDGLIPAMKDEHEANNTPKGTGKGKSKGERKGRGKGKGRRKGRGSGKR